LTSPRVNPDAGHHPEETSATDDGNQHTHKVPPLGHWGDPMANIADDTIRILYQNVNGLSTSSSVYEEVKLNIVRLGSHLTTMSETNLNWQNHKTRDTWESTLQREYADMLFSHSSCNEGSSTTSYQRGGTSMVCNSRLGSRLLEKGSDADLGRWSWMRSRGGHGRKILIISAYQVSQCSPSGLGHETFYMQQWRQIAKSATPNDNPRQRFWSKSHCIYHRRSSGQRYLINLGCQCQLSGSSLFTICG